MAKIVVDVMLKPEILDPQGKAVAAALPRLGFTFAKDVRQGKRFEIEVDGQPTAAQLAEVEKAAEKKGMSTMINSVEPVEQGVAEDQVEESSPEALAKIDELTRK